MRTAVLAIGMALLITTSTSECAEIACDAAVVRQAWGLLKMPHRDHESLSLGIHVIGEVNRLGMLVDLSQCLPRR